LREELKQIRRDGFGIAEEELEPGLSAVAAPIWDHAGQAVAAISVSGPAFRLPRKRLEELGIETKRVADAISYKIGHIAEVGDPALAGS
jgi:DNA-binding IclR family transcriptional regulator